MSTNTAAATTDGRRLRSERSRQALIAAAISLIDENVLVATAQQVSDRANVGIRTLFRHFSDMETLYKAVCDEIHGDYEALFRGGERQGTLQERIRNMVERRAAAFEIIKKVVLSTKALSWRSEVLRETYVRYQRLLRKNLENWLPELRSLDPRTREAVDAVGSFEMWHRLREEQGLGPEQTIRIIVHTLTVLINKS